MASLTVVSWGERDSVLVRMRSGRIKNKSFLCRILSDGCTCGRVRETGNGEDMSGPLTNSLVASFIISRETLTRSLMANWSVLLYINNWQGRRKNPDLKSVSDACEEIIYKHRNRVGRWFWCNTFNIYCSGRLRVQNDLNHEDLLAVEDSGGKRCTELQTDQTWASLQKIYAYEIYIEYIKLPWTPYFLISGAACVGDTFHSLLALWSVAATLNLSVPD